jgi:uncharacterized protein DUF892
MLTHPHEAILYRHDREWLFEVWPYEGAELRVLKNRARQRMDPPEHIRCDLSIFLIDEAQDASGEVDDKDVLDAAIIAAGQAAEHYEITATARS